MSRLTFRSDGRRVKGGVRKEPEVSGRSPDDIVRGMKEETKKPPGEDYRERSLRIHGLVCAHCGRVFEEANRHLLTVHHRDGNHRNNPPDGSNWENLCVYCHENAHSREVLGEYLGGSGGGDRDRPVVSGGGGAGFGLLAEKLKKAMKNKGK